MKLINLFLIFLVVLFVNSCEKDTTTDDNYGMYYEGAIYISFVDAQNQDLLNTENFSFLRDFALYYLNNDNKVSISYSLSDGEKSPNYYIRFNPKIDELEYIETITLDTDVWKGDSEVYQSIPHYMKTGENNVDTLIIEYYRYKSDKGQSYLINRIIYNDQDIVKDINGLFTVIKE